MKQTTSGTEAWRKAKLLETMELPDLPPPDLELLQQFLVDHHDVFSLEDGVRGETDLVRMEIDTGDTRLSQSNLPLEVWCPPGAGYFEVNRPPLKLFAPLRFNVPVSYEYGDPRFWGPWVPKAIWIRGPRPQIYIDMGTPIPISMVDMGTPS